MSWSEFDLIEWLKTEAEGRADVLIGIGDDAAVLRPWPDHDLITTTDTSVSGVHFPGDLDPFSIGYKSLAVSLSDMAAMGGAPAWILLSLTLPQLNAGWIQAFFKGFFEVARPYRVVLVGGDTTAGPLSVTTTVFGFVPRSQAILRSGALEGDTIFVTAPLGASGLAFDLWKKKELALHPDRAFLEKAWHRPEPAIEVGQLLRGKATSMIDISDGLLADLGHIVNASRVGAVIQAERLPLAAPLAQLPKLTAWKFALTGGEDYHLCFTSPLSELELKRLGIPAYPIGIITQGSGIVVKDEIGCALHFQRKGYEHFSPE